MVKPNIPGLPSPDFCCSFNFHGLFDLWDFLMHNSMVVPPARHIYMLSLVLGTAQDLFYFVLFGLSFG